MIYLENSCSDKSSEFLDIEYTQKQHLDNLTRYKRLTKKLVKMIPNEDINLELYYKRLKDYYWQVEMFLEAGTGQVMPIIREIVFDSYNMLTTIEDKPLDTIMDELFNTYDSKNWDYQNSSENQLMWDGAYSFKVTLGHKVSRIKSFYERFNFEVKDEKIQDTIADLTNYCLIYLMWLNKGTPKLR
ncbi:MAG: hypothetical protein ACOCZ5_00610 [bacterium]